MFRKRRLLKVLALVGVGAALAVSVNRAYVKREAIQKKLLHS